MPIEPIPIPPEPDTGQVSAGARPALGMSVDAEDYMHIWPLFPASAT